MDQGIAAGLREARRAALFVARAASWPMRLRWNAVAAAAYFGNMFERELAERAGFQWLAVGFGCGCLGYFALPREPLLAPLAAGAIAAASWAVIAYRRDHAWRIAAVIAVCLAGAATAKGRVDALAGNRIERPMSADLTGRVVDRDTRSGRRSRIVLDSIASEAIPPGATPDRLRLTLAAKHGLPELGARVALRARVTPVSGPVVPGGYDPRRAAFFDGMGGSGFVLGAWTPVGAQAPASFDLTIAMIRAAAVARIMAQEPGEAGAVAAALLVGERSALSEDTNESLRLSGLAHILSISGLHMMLIAGTAFFVTRAALALSPPLALAYPIRKWAALAALAVVTAYFALSGGGAATVRSYVMAAIMFAAILLDRPAISMRNLAVAAFIVLALEPESIVEPGFQMSFAAVVALIAGWEAWSERRRARLAEESAIPGLRFLRPIGRAVLGVALTSLIAGLATAPFAAYHFERVTTYALLGNLLAAPLVSAVIMPFGLLTLAAMPLGLEGLPLAVMARGIDMLLLISDWVGGLPGAEVGGVSVPTASVLLMAGGLLWLCLWRLSWRWFGVPIVAAGLAFVPILATRPDIMVGPEGRQLAVRDEGGVLRAAGGKAGSYAIKQFFAEEAETRPDAKALHEGVRCDALACLMSAAAGLTVSQVLDPAAFAEDCRRADIIVTPLQAPPGCAARLVIDAARLTRFGAHAVAVGESGGTPIFKITTERSEFPRPWQAGGAAGETQR